MSGSDRWGGRDWSRMSMTRVGQIVVATEGGRFAAVAAVSDNGGLVIEIAGQMSDAERRRRAESRRYNQRRRERMKAARQAARTVHP